MGSLKKIWRLMQGNKLLYICAIVASGFATLFNMAPPIFIKIIVDSVLQGLPVDAAPMFMWMIDKVGGLATLEKNIWICSVGIVSATLLSGICSYLKARYTAIASENIARNTKDRLYDHIQKLPYEYHVKAQTGDLIQRCTSDVDTIRRFLSGQIIEVVRSVFIVTFAVYIMSGMSMKLTMISLIMMPFIFFFSFAYFKKVTATFKLADEKEGELSTVLQENLSGIRVVRAFGRQQFEVDKFEVKNSEFRELGFKVTQWMAYFWSFSDFMCVTQVAVVLFVGINLCVSGEITLGTLTLFTAYVNQMVWPLRQLGRILSDMGKMQVSLGRVDEILYTPIETDTEGAVSHDLRGDIVFDQVYFDYEKNNPVLQGISFTIKAGETIAILGATGSGKSSIMHILLRLYDYKGGSVTINGIELRQIQKKWLREKIGIVLQEPFLFSKTIRNNIKMAKNVVEDHEIFDATKTASVHHVIEEFEEGYDTIVGEKGVTLSGGQKQRVAIARTLVKNSDILIFDDSLSAVDTETDAQIRAALKEKRQGVTTFIISQRITTLMEADRIFILERGVLTDAGTHDELIGRDGLYSRIWNIQNMLEEDFDEEASE